MTTAVPFKHPPTPPAIRTNVILRGGKALPLYPPVVATKWTRVPGFCAHCRRVHEAPAAPLEDAA